MKKILVIVNKSWEVDPVISAMTASKIKPPRLPFPDPLNIPVPDWKSPAKAPKQRKPRAVFEFYKTIERKPEDLLSTTAVWCIEDLMDPSKNSSSSEEKAVQLNWLFFSEKNVDLVIAFGTAGFNDRHTSFNGSVILGAEFFVHNAVPNNPESKFEHKEMETHIVSNLDSSVSKKLFGLITDKFKDIVESKLLPVPNAPAARAKVLAASNFIALGNVNITNYNDYSWADEDGLNSYHSKKIKSPIGSIETTHGVIRLCSPYPTVFVSAISDRLGYFSSEVNPAQNFISSFNGGVFLSYFITELINA